MAKALDSAVTRRAAIAMIGVAAAMPTLVANPTVFDAHAYINDLRMTGHHVELLPGGWVSIGKRTGLGRAYTDIAFKWQRAIDRADDHIGEMRELLFAEMQQSRLGPNTVAI